MTGIEIAATAAALGMSTGLLVAVIAAVWWFDRYDREPLHLVAGVCLWGALAAPVFSVTGCSALGAGLDLGQITIAGWIGPALEEFAKAAGVVLVVLFSREFDNPTDGVVYGTAAGLGFAATENLCYAVAGIGNGAIGQTLLVVAVRTAMAAGIHAVLSGPALERLNESPIERVLVTNTTPLGEKLEACSKLQPFSVAPLLGEAIRRIHEQSSVSSLFV